MPIYEYRCRECGKVLDVLVRGTEVQSIRCPECGSDDLKRLISGFHTVGSDYSTSGRTCCGRTERCESPPCSAGGTCRRG